MMLLNASVNCMPEKWTSNAMNAFPMVHMKLPQPPCLKSLASPKQYVTATIQNKQYPQLNYIHFGLWSLRTVIKDCGDQEPK